MTIAGTKIPGSDVTLVAIEDSGIFYALIYIGEDFWDHREFPTAVERDAFIANPNLSGKRTEARVEVETLDTSYLDTVDGPWRRVAR